MKKISKQAYTTEFKERSVKRVKGGESVSTGVKELGLSDQTLRNWMKAATEGSLKGTGRRVVTPEEMELSRASHLSHDNFLSKLVLDQKVLH